MLKESRTDEELYRDYFIHGNSDALQCLVERYSDSLTFFLKGIVKTHEDAEDLMIETFAQLLSRDRHFHGKSSFKTWLFAIGRNQALKFLRHNRFIRMDEVTSSQVPSPEEFIVHQEQHKEILTALLKLPDDYREVLFLIYVEDLRYEDAAKIMHKNVKQITNLAYRGKQMLKKLLPQDYSLLSRPNTPF